MHEDFHLKNKVRFVTAAALFDGHDAAIHVIRRVLQSEGAEVIHLGHNCSVDEVVKAAVEEDAQGIAVSSYQGGHIEYFTYMLERLKALDAGHIKVFGGGGGVIVPAEIELLEQRGVSRIFSPDDGLKLGLVGMIRFMLEACDSAPHAPLRELPEVFSFNSLATIARAISTLETGLSEDATPALKATAGNLRTDIAQKLKRITSPATIVGFTGTGGSGKSSLIDEMLIRFLEAFPQKRIAVLSVDPTKKKSGGALLGDRIRMNCAKHPRVFVRSMATRRAHLATSLAVTDALKTFQVAGFDLVFFETAGIGQSDSEAAELADLSAYVMTPEFGAPTQLEKIDMLDFADLVAINKFDKGGARDALREVRKVYQRSRKQFDVAPERMPVFATSAHRFHDRGMNTFFNALFRRLATLRPTDKSWEFTPFVEGDAATDSLLPPSRSHYLAEIANSVRSYRRQALNEAEKAQRLEACVIALKELSEPVPETLVSIKNPTTTLAQRYNAILTEMHEDTVGALNNFSHNKASYQSAKHTYSVRGKPIEVANTVLSLAKNPIPKVVGSNATSAYEIVRFAFLENFPGYFPFTAGVFPFRRAEEDPTRMFAGEGMAERTNKRFHYLCLGQKAHRLSTAFDSVTLYGADPHTRPDIYGKIGNAGVSVCTLDDAKRLYSGFDLLAPTTSVSMTINGPAPTLLAFFFNTAIDSAVERFLKKDGAHHEIEKKRDDFFKSRGVRAPTYRANFLPEGHDGSGLFFLGVPSSFLVPKELHEQVAADALKTMRGTVQADILKEDQAQNTCIFSTEFALRMMGDVQDFFNKNHVRNFYSVSVSGYHIAEAGANPVTQLAFTLANGFTLVEYYKSRGMDVSAFARNFSFFFSNGLDPEYAVIGRVARRIWAIAMRTLYDADERSQKLKYHIQTSGRSLHAQEIGFNDIRTTLQAFYALADNCNSLHTNAYDEAITTPTEESVRRAVAIQHIINKELGLLKNECALQGSYFIEYLTDMVEEAVLKEFESLDARGGVLGAMETMYQRSKIQEESLHYETLKHSGELPIVGVNTFLQGEHATTPPLKELIRSTDDEKALQVAQIEQLNACMGPWQQEALAKLKKTAAAGQNIFAELMECTKVCSLGTISNALYEAGGAYRRSM
jgi:methylmalonyl-CoA mutase